MAVTHGSLRSSERVEPEEFSRRAAARLGEAATDHQVLHGQAWANVPADRLLDVVSTLHSDPELSCDYLTFLSAVDWQEEGFELVIVLYSTINEATIGIKAKLPRERPSAPSISSIYGGALWHERECAEMFGIDFEGHPDLKNLYLPDDFEGHPLRKDFRLASREFKPWPGAKDPDEAAGGR